MLLTLDGVTKSYPGAAGARVLNGISLRLARGEYVAVIGESGSGKSTLLNLIAGLDVPDSGQILFDGIAVGALRDEERTRLRRTRFGFVFQAFHLLPYLNVVDNVMLPLELNGHSRAQARGRAEALLDAVGLKAQRHKFPRELAGGEMQRIGVIRALAARPSLVLADEPTGNLDAKAADTVLQLLQAQIKADGAAGILVTHSLTAAATADRSYRLTADGLQLVE